MQKWFLMQLIGVDDDINLNVFDHAEFDDWKWGNKDTAIKSVIKFKRKMYELLKLLSK